MGSHDTQMLRICKYMHVGMGSWKFGLCSYATIGTFLCLYKERFYSLYLCKTTVYQEFYWKVCVYKLHNMPRNN